MTYDVIYNGSIVNRVITNKTSEEVAEWYKKYMGAEQVKVTECDNLNAIGQQIVRL